MALISLCTCRHRQEGRSSPDREPQNFGNHLFVASLFASSPALNVHLQLFSVSFLFNPLFVFPPLLLKEKEQNKSVWKMDLFAFSTIQLTPSLPFTLRTHNNAHFHLFHSSFFLQSQPMEEMRAANSRNPIQTLIIHTTAQFEESQLHLVESQE